MPRGFFYCYDMDMASDYPYTKIHTWESYHPKRVSYILPTKNRADLLHSALMQFRTFIEPQDELIIVDGASTDRTRDVVEKHKDIVNLFVSEPDKPGEASNKGLLMARGKYFKLLLDDEPVNPEAMKKAIQVLDEHQEIELLVCGGTVYTRDGKKSYIYVPPGANFGQHPDDVLRYWTGNGSGFVYRRSLFAKVGIFSPTLVNDYEFITRCLHQKIGVAFCRVNLYENRITNDSVTIRRGASALQEKMAITKKYCSRTVYYLYRLEKNRLIRRFGLQKLMRPAYGFVESYRLSGIPGLVKHVRNAFKQRSNTGVPPGPIWDGGFS